MIDRFHSTGRYSVYCQVGSVSSFLGQKIQASASENLTPPASHSTYCTPPVAFPIQPPTIAPTKRQTNPKSLRFLLIFLVGPSRILGSEAKSHITLVKTTVGSSLIAKFRLQTIWPAAWKLNSAIGNSSLQLILCMTVLISPTTALPCTTPAIAQIRTHWRRNERTNVFRFPGPRNRQKRAKNPAPIVKHRIEVPDFAQPYESFSCDVEAPRPKKIVFPETQIVWLVVASRFTVPRNTSIPVCIDTKVPYAVTMNSRSV